MTTAFLVVTWPTPDGSCEAEVNHFGKTVVTARRATPRDAVAVALIQLGIDLREGKLDLQEPPPVLRRRPDNRELAASLRALAEEIEEKAVTP